MDLSHDLRARLAAWLLEDAPVREGMPAVVRRWHADPFGFLRPWGELPGLMGSAPPATPRRHRPGHLPDGAASSRPLSQQTVARSAAGRAPDLLRVVEHAIQITTQDFRVQEELRTRERPAALVARGASRTMRSRHLAGHAVDLVAPGGSEISWLGEDLFRIPATMQAAARELGVPVRWAGCCDAS